MEYREFTIKSQESVKQLIDAAKARGKERKRKLEKLRTREAEREDTHAQKLPRYEPEVLGRRKRPNS